jgi:membrane protease YdiL (CAAX protease family)
MQQGSRRFAQAALAQGKCPVCGYQTAGLAGVATCPECGHDWSQWMTKEDVGTPDPGTPRAGLIATVAVFVLIVVVAVLQQTSESAAAKAAGSPPSTQVAGAVDAPSAQFEVIAKAGTKVYFARPDKGLADSLVSMLDKEAQTAADRLRVGIVAGELQGESDARKRMTEAAADADEAVKKDAGIVGDLYRGGADRESIDGLVTRHGWFGRLAATHGRPATDPERARVIGGGDTLIALSFAGLIGGVLVALASCVLFITGIVMAAGGTLRARFVRPAPGGSVAAETAAVFVAAFIGLKLLTGLIEGVSGSATTAVVCAMGMQWALIAVLLWPVVRGVRARQALRLWGLHAERGVLREIGLGLVGYLAILPLVVVGAIVSFALMMLYQAVRLAMGVHETHLPDNPVLEILSGKSSQWVIVLLGLLASLWAPLVEEAMFRGALYRQLRSWWHWLPAGLVTALGFGLMHGYPLLLLGPVIALGFGFALLREWRGSLIASMTAHCVHNTMVITLVLVAMKFVGG